MQRLVRYLAASRAELVKTTWPTRRQTTRLTGLVIVFAVFTAAIIGALDYLFSLGLQQLVS